MTYRGIFFILFYIFNISYFGAISNLKSNVGNFVELGLFPCLGIAPLFWGLIHEKTLVNKILSLPIMILLGKASHIFYLIHKGFIPISIDEHIWNNKLF